MKLVDIVNTINMVDDESIIFQEDRENFDSDVILAIADEGGRGVKDEGEKKYYYLIEIFLAKEFIDDWVASLNVKPTAIEIAKRLYDYAIKDA